MKLYIEDNQVIPAVHILPDTDPAPAGYTEKTSIEDWYNYGRSSLDCCFGFNYLTWRGKILDLVIAIVTADYSNWAGLTAEEKLIASELILAPYALRVTVVSDTTDKRNWLALVGKAQGLPVSEFNGRAEVIEKMREGLSEELRVESMSKDDIDQFDKDTYLMIGYFQRSNAPDFKQWLTNEVGSPYENDGFAQKTYYTVARRDYLLDLYNGQF